MSCQGDLTIVHWIGRLGAATADDAAARFGLGARAARAKLGAAARAGLLARRRMLAEQPALYLATRSGLRAAGLDQLATCRVSAASFMHARACARVAVALEREHPRRVMSDRELRAAERGCGRPLASAELGIGRDGEPRRHHPDLVLWPSEQDGGRPLAIEVELTVKAPRRLQAICRAWARNRRVCGVLYYAAPPAERALRRAVVAMYAEEFVDVRPLREILDPRGGDLATIPSQADPTVALGESTYHEGGFALDVVQPPPRPDNREPD